MTHPWIEAAGVMDIQPISNAVKIEIIRGNVDGVQQEFPMLVIVTPAGVMTFILDPDQFSALKENVDDVSKRLSKSRIYIATEMPS